MDHNENIFVCARRKIYNATQRQLFWVGLRVDANWDQTVKWDGHSLKLLCASLLPDLLLNTQQIAKLKLVIFLVWSDSSLWWQQTDKVKKPIFVYLDKKINKKKET